MIGRERVFVYFNRFLKVRDRILGLF